MSETTDTGFKFGKIARWAPAIIMVLGFVLFATGDILFGALAMVAALVFWFIVRRRKQGVTAGSDAVARPST